VREENTLKPVMLVGVALIILGAVALAYQGITHTTREKSSTLDRSRLRSTRKRAFPCLRSSAAWRLRAA